MEMGALWSALGIGAAGLLLGLVGPRRQPPSEQGIGRQRILLLLGVPVVLFVVSLPSRSPFAAGSGLGIGLLLGGLCGAAAAATLVRGSVLAAPSCWVQVVAPVAASHVWFRPTLLDTLAGIAIGYLCAAAIARYTEPQAEPEIDLLPTAAFAALVALASLLAVHRGATALEDQRWVVAGLAVCVAGPLALLVTALPSRLLAAVGLRVPGAVPLVRLFTRITDPGADREAAAAAARYLFVLAVVSLTAWQAGRLVSGGGALLMVSLTGLAAGAVVAWLVHPAAPEVPATLASVLLAAMVALAASMVGFQLLAGFGATLAAVLAWLVIAVAGMREDAEAWPGSVSAALQAPLLAAVVFAAYRAVMTRHGALASSSPLTDHYAVFGVAAGVALPGLIGQYLNVSRSQPLARLALAGMICLAAPGLLMVLWGAKIAVPLMIGLALCPPLLTAAATGSKEAARLFAAVALIALGMALAMVQWTGHALLAAELTRDERIRILAYVLSALLILVLAGELATRRRERETHAGSAAP